MKKTLITGAEGFVGQNLMQIIPNAIPYDRERHNFFKPETMKETIESVDNIIHLAGTNAGTKSQPTPYAMIHNNLDLTYQLIKAIKLFALRKPRVIFISSIHVYEQNHAVVSEETAIGPAAIYGAVKYAQEMALKQAALLGLIELVIFRATHIYGPRAKPFYNSAVATMCFEALRGNTIDLYGNGEVTLDLLYVRDLAHYVQRALELPAIQETEIFNVASGSRVKVSEIAKTIEILLETKVNVNLLDTPVRDSVLNIEKLKSRMGPLNHCSLRDGLRAQLAAAKLLI